MVLELKVRQFSQATQLHVRNEISAAHESPYLNKGNYKTILRAGMVFTSEPGIYLIDRFGVRHEDVFVVQDNDEPLVLTGHRARGPWDP